MFISSSSNVRKVDRGALRGTLRRFAARFTPSVTYQSALIERTLDAAFDDPKLIDGNIERVLFQHMHWLVMYDRDKVGGKRDSEPCKPTVPLY